MNYLISYPRSGNTWTRYCIEHLTDKKTVGYENNHGVIWESKGIRPELWGQKTFVKKVHGSTPTNDKNDKCILLIRNPKEALIRHGGRIEGWTSYLDFYENKFRGKKLLIYYENLIQDLESNIKKVLELLEVKVDDEKYNNFFSNISFHKQQCIDMYEARDAQGKNPQNESTTQGNSLIYHSKKMPVSEKLDMDNFLLEKYSNITSKYLIRYLEDINK